MWIALPLLMALLGSVLCDKLLQIQSVCRHGDRAPTGTYKNDPYQADFWPMGWGELTNIGMTQHLQQGSKLRQKYIRQLNFIPAKYRSSYIRARSDDSDRTIMSALAFLAGFYADSPNTHPENTLWPRNWNPVPVHNVKHGTDHLINAHASCQRAKELEIEQLAHPKFLEYVDTQLPYLEIVANQTGDPPSDLNSFGNAFDAIYIEKQHNLTMPAWITNDLYNHLLNLTYNLIDFMNGGPGFGKSENTELIMLQGGVLLQEMIDNMENAIAGHGPLYHLYSGHDTTVAAHLRAFGAKVGTIGIQAPKFASLSVVELWDGDGKPYVKLWYADDAATPLRDVTHTIQGCGGGDRCNFGQFKQRSQPYVATPENIVARCDNLLG